MSAAERLLSEVLALPAADRAELAHRLLESLGTVPEHHLDAAWIAGLERRAHEVQSGAVMPIPWQAARDNIMTEPRKRRVARCTP